MIIYGYCSIANDGSVFYFHTNENAPQYKLISIDISMKEPSSTIVIPERRDALLCSVSRVHKDRFVVQYKHNVIHFPINGRLIADLYFQVKDQIHIYDNGGRKLEQLFPDFVGSMTAHCRPSQPWLFITMSSFTTPGTIAYYDFRRPEDQRTSIFRQIQVGGINPDDFETCQVRDCPLSFPKICSNSRTRFGIPAGTVPKFPCSLSVTNPPRLMVARLRSSMVSL